MAWLGSQGSMSLLLDMPGDERGAQERMRSVGWSLGRGTELGHADPNLDGPASGTAMEAGLEASLPRGPQLPSSA